MTKDSRLARRAKKKNAARILAVLQTSRAGQLMTPKQLKSRANQMATSWISWRRKCLKKEEELDNASGATMSNDVAEFLSMSESSGEFAGISADESGEMSVA